ncbi:MAG: Flavodoxin/nitric oxide synthase [Microgenomates group bacterium GW2011_GWF2_45_18]|nr:MAG: Flavodoxin/nitric oxide synthase [Microgenomates group bacterium GW2011_GWF1_44_10]KKU01866.1 MAG: Flavodoxin/nitric oxide synthase [Microgenomates group bacterium GW2011_GWF2_45_18]OGJ41112.1 MAG: hypothetical protein A2378_04495 [Candidatus Pacebacteria bacterium RIFOXYB1_FULL_44_10]HAU98817.1 nitric oxide synthase [Candidatus Paceibacterota bacterium]HAX01363.1 nitric oxide synthase [Candidatus Paceibacterota bacterium]
MNILIVYDSLYGNTKKIALEMLDALLQQKESFGQKMKVEAMYVQDVTQEHLLEADLLIVGSPTHGGRAKPSMQMFLDAIPLGALTHKKVAVFDTRFLEREQNFALRALLKTIGYAAPKIADVLQKKGGEIVLPPEGFIVKGKTGPISNGELERAREWAIQVIQSIL